LFANIAGNHTGDNGWVVQWGDRFGRYTAPNEAFYLHPTSSS
jgi:hypothetical protein